MQSYQQNDAVIIKMSRDRFEQHWTSYRQGQATMLNNIVTFLNSTGNPSIADEIKESFKTQENVELKDFRDTKIKE